VFTVTLSPPAAERHVKYSTATTAPPRERLHRRRQRVAHLHAGQTSKTITINVTGDTAYEDGRDLLVNLSTSPTRPFDSQGKGRSPTTTRQPTISSTTSSLTEPTAAAPTPASRFRFPTRATRRSRPGLDATAPPPTSDYTRDHESVVTFLPGRDSKTAERPRSTATRSTSPTRPSSSTLTSPSNATISDSQGQGRSTNNDRR
jgi:hypothetical protein